MINNAAASLILEARLVAILRLRDLSDAVPLAEALLAGGIRALEFTLTNAAAPQAIADCLANLDAFKSGSATIGMGSIRSLEEARIAVDCGSQFLVTPFTDVEVIAFAKSHSLAVCPGAFTPTEIATAHRAGADIVKVFPARDLGPNYIRDVLAPMPFLKLMPTGGVDLNNALDYFSAGAVAVGVGGQFVDPEAIADRDWERIRVAAERFSQLCRKAGN